MKDINRTSETLQLSIKKLKIKETIIIEATLIAGSCFKPRFKCVKNIVVNFISIIFKPEIKHVCVWTCADMRVAVLH